MATTAPGSPYVESSDLVANYPAVSEALAERVDTVGVLPFADSTARGTAIPSPPEGQYTYLQDTNATEYWDGSAWVAAGVAPGLVHINTTTFSTVSSVSLNSIFSSTYTHYRVLIDSTHSTQTEMRIRLRASGTDSTTNYYAKLIYSRFDATTVNGDAVINNGDNWWAGMGSTTRGISLDIFNPFEAVPTRVSNVTGDNNHGSAGGAYHSASTSYDGLTLYPTAGTMSGICRIYGYKNS